MDWVLEDGKKALARMRERASCRSFDRREITADILREILDTGLAAASGGNLQPLSIIKITNNEDKTKVCEACGRQKFIEEAPVNLLFLLDWYKMSIFAESQDAPFTCNDSFMHFLIGLEDVMCTAQSIETAAHLMGLGSCYVGTTNQCADTLSEMLNLPRYTFPVVMLSVGYPASELKVRDKLAYDIMVFEDRYPELSKEQINGKYYDKYGDSSMKLPTNPAYRAEMLKIFEEALLTTYPAERTAEIIAAADKAGAINETQRRFGLHYNAKRMRETGYNVINMFAEQELTPFRLPPK